VNVIEQVGVVHRAAELGASCLVVECMAVDPNLQELNQRKLILNGTTFGDAGGAGILDGDGYYARHLRTIRRL
jgi:hypothetical protein